MNTIYVGGRNYTLIPRPIRTENLTLKITFDEESTHHISLYAYAVLIYDVVFVGREHVISGVSIVKEIKERHPYWQNYHQLRELFVAGNGILWIRWRTIPSESE